MLKTRDDRWERVGAMPGTLPFPEPDLIPRLPGVPPHAVPYVRHLRLTLMRYRSRPRTEVLDTAFAAAGALVAAVIETPHDARPDLEEMRRLATSVAELGEFLDIAAGETEQVVHAAAAGLWRALGLTSAPPRWTPGEREAARMVFACACAPARDADPERLRSGLRALAANRMARLLCQELAGAETAWLRALGARYDSVRHRCAPRTAWRSRGLSDLVREDDRAAAALTVRLERWLADGRPISVLAAELEAALVHARTPARFA